MKNNISVTKLWGSGVFNGLSRCFLRVMTPVENENYFFSTLLILKVENAKNQVVTKVKKVKICKKIDMSKFPVRYHKFQICFSCCPLKASNTWFEDSKL